MNKFTQVLKYVIIILGITIIAGILFSACDNLRCYPEFDLNGEYIGIVCEGKF